MKQRTKQIEYSNYIPRFKLFRKRGKFPLNLLFGFEQEVEKRWSTQDELETAIRKIINNRQFLYAKEEYSLNNGCEINTHPFNFNWFLQNDFNYIDEVAKEFKALRTCGFHVHISRKYFTRLHLLKMIKLFYAYPIFIHKVSQRTIFTYCKTDIQRDVKYFMADSLRCRYSDIDDIDFTQFNDCRKTLELFDSLHRDNDDSMKYTALNLAKKTIEIRIFQGTVNKKLIRAYLEFCLACVLYTKQASFKSVSIKGLKKFVNKNSGYFSYLIDSRLLMKTKKIYHWKKVA